MAEIWRFECPSNLSQAPSRSPQLAGPVQHRVFARADSGQDSATGLVSSSTWSMSSEKPQITPSSSSLIIARGAHCLRSKCLPGTCLIHLPPQRRKARKTGRSTSPNHIWVGVALPQRLMGFRVQVCRRQAVNQAAPPAILEDGRAHFALLRITQAEELELDALGRGAMARSRSHADRSRNPKAKRPQ